MKQLYLYALLFVLILSCVGTKKLQQSTDAFDFQAHRGGRGLMPENTIPTMLQAMDFPELKTLEMDVVVSKDGQLVVSHDPFFNAAITAKSNGEFLTSQEASKLILFQMDYDQIIKYDVGMKPHPDFPRQAKMAVTKPLLANLIDSVMQKAAQLKRTITFNIEIKSKKATDNINHPAPEPFADKLVGVLQKKRVLEYCVIQSFDPRPLQYIHRRYPTVKTSFLVDKNGGDKVNEQIQKLGFEPNVYSPVYGIVTKELVEACHSKNMKVVPWTVNSPDEIQKLVDLGVDGVISDYPDIFQKIKLKL